MSEVLPKSGLIIEIPESETAVGRHRDALDGNARLGVPAHITVLSPFMPPVQIDSTILARLRRLFAAERPFDVELTHTSWFEHDVLWLAPEDPQPFRTLTEHVCSAFPGFPPFAGQFADVVPHLTIAHGCDPVEMHAAERAVQGLLPIQGCARQVTLLTQTEAGGAWSRAARFPLGAPQPPLLPDRTSELTTDPDRGTLEALL